MLNYSSIFNDIYIVCYMKSNLVSQKISILNLSILCSIGNLKTKLLQKFLIFESLIHRYFYHMSSFILLAHKGLFILSVPTAHYIYHPDNEAYTSSIIEPFVFQVMSWFCVTLKLLRSHQHRRLSLDNSPFLRVYNDAMIIATYT